VAIAEIGRASNGRLLARQERRPEQRAPDEKIRRHQVDLHPVREHHDEAADQPHVVSQWHPRHGNVAVVAPGCLGDTACIREDVAVRQHHALGVAGRAGGILDEGGVAGSRADRVGRAADVFEVVDQEGACAQLLKCRLFALFLGKFGEAPDRLEIRIEPRLTQLPGDAQQLEAVLVADANGERDRDNTACDRRPETVDECLIVVQENNQVIATRQAEALQSPEDAERALVQLCV